MEEIKVHLDKVLKSRNITSKELAEKIGITEANLSILKTGKAKGVRFNTLMSICRELECQPGDILDIGEIMMKVIEVLGVTLLFGLLSGCGIISEATYDTAGAIKN